MPDADPTTRPLHGVRVVSLAVNLPGPLAAARLAALGAQVTKVEPPTGDPLRAVAEAWYRELVAGQEVLVADLKSQAGHAQLLDLLADVDLLLTATRPAALERLGLGWDRLHDALPRLCQVALVGHAAPHDDLPGHGLTYQAGSGTLVPPTMPTVLVADLAGAERAVADGLAALVSRATSGLGSRREVALSDVAHDMAEPVRQGLTARGGPLGGGLPTYRLYATAQGHVAVAALEPHFAARLCELLGVGAHGGGADGGGADAVQLARVLATRTAAEWQVWGRANGLPLAEVLPPGGADGGPLAECRHG